MFPTIKNEQEVAEDMSQFYVEKVEKIRNNIMLDLEPDEIENNIDLIVSNLQGSNANNCFSSFNCLSITDVEE